MIIKPKKGWQLIDFKELKDYRDLFYFLVARDIKVRYKQTVLGGLWAIIQPFFMKETIKRWNSNSTIFLRHA